MVYCQSIFQYDYIGVAMPGSFKCSALRLLKNLMPMDNGCLQWVGYTDRAGYGIVSMDGNPHRVHRVMWAAANGPIPEDLVLDHLCKNRACANLKHLEAVSNEENLMRGDGVGAKNAARTHCLYGHPFDKVWGKSKQRYCSVCHRERTARWARENRDKINEKSKREREERRLRMAIK